MGLLVVALVAMLGVAALSFDDPLWLQALIWFVIALLVGLMIWHATQVAEHREIKSK